MVKPICLCYTLGDIKNARHENVELENAAKNCKARKCKT